MADAEKAHNDVVAGKKRLEKELDDVRRDRDEKGRKVSDLMAQTEVDKKEPKWRWRN